ncbi:MAG TPA: DnaB-like helicase N-terminal domain-containing protein [Bryobacteraceae bacterium]|nr:DnaB-like helicase N-terminal domain-containing protein [Bryobacteraceae bacterium]
MSADFKPRRERSDPAANRTKVRPIRKRVDPMEKGLPANLDVERFVLGSLLLDGSACSEVALNPDDFSIERHRHVLGCIQSLHTRGEQIDYVTVAEELGRRNELGADGLSFLISLTEGMPYVAHLDSYVRILRNKSTLRRTIFESQKVMNECLLETAAPDEILGSHLAEIEGLRGSVSGDRRLIRRIEDLESIFAKRTPLEYLVKPELPVKAVVCLTGDSESGKTTLACAWARDVFRQGHAVLILDRDKNPRDRICDRLERLGIQTDGEFFRVWDCEQDEEPPQPDDPIVVDWVKRMVVATGKSPVVIVDSLVSFFVGDEDENSAVDMRALFNRCRALTKLGATVIPLHHTNRSGEARGSSDFRPASDQAFLVRNCDRDGGRLLDVITLECEKSRYGLSGRIEYHYADGKMLRVEDRAPSKPVSEQLLEELKANPGILSEPFAELAYKRGLGRNRGREFLKTGVRNGTIEVRKEGRKRHHFWRGAEGGMDDLDPQGRLDRGCVTPGSTYPPPPLF